MRPFTVAWFFVVQFRPVSKEEIRLNGNHIIGLSELPIALLAVFKHRLLFAYHALLRGELHEAITELFGDPVDATFHKQMNASGYDMMSPRRQKLSPELRTFVGLNNDMDL